MTPYLKSQENNPLPCSPAISLYLQWSCCYLTLFSSKHTEDTPCVPQVLTATRDPAWSLANGVCELYPDSFCALAQVLAAGR